MFPSNKVLRRKSVRLPICTGKYVENCILDCYAPQGWFDCRENEKNRQLPWGGGGVKVYLYSRLTILMNCVILLLGEVLCEKLCGAGSRFCVRSFMDSSHLVLLPVQLPSLSGPSLFPYAEGQMN